jgi:hypothetical protein
MSADLDSRAAMATDAPETSAHVGNPPRTTDAAVQHRATGPRDLFSDAASVASILGFLITVWVAWTIRTIKAHFFAKARLPEYQKKLEKSASALSAMLGQAVSGLPEMQAELSRLCAHAKSAHRACPRSLKADLKELIQMVEGHSRLEDTRRMQNLRDIYAKALTCATALRNHVEDSEWSGT